jgi:hypothetical protein
MTGPPVSPALSRTGFAFMTSALQTSHEEWVTPQRGGDEKRLPRQRWPCLPKHNNNTVKSGAAAPQARKGHEEGWGASWGPRRHIGR